MRFMRIFLITGSFLLFAIQPRADSSFSFKIGYDKNDDGFYHRASHHYSGSACGCDSLYPHRYKKYRYRESHYLKCTCCPCKRMYTYDHISLGQGCYEPYYYDKHYYRGYGRHGYVHKYRHDRKYHRKHKYKSRKYRSKYRKRRGFLDDERCQENHSDSIQGLNHPYRPNGDGLNYPRKRTGHKYSKPKRSLKSKRSIWPSRPTVSGSNKSDPDRISRSYSSSKRYSTTSRTRPSRLHSMSGSRGGGRVTRSSASNRR